jgi:DNA-binding NarL/FixJ family response regulator
VPHRVLVVDDEPPVLRLAKRILEEAGFAALMAKDGPEAVAVLEDYEVDVLLTDVVMPGMSGTDLILEARKRHPGLPACYMTGHAADCPLLDVPIIAKPFAPAELVATVQQALKTGAKQQPDTPLTDLHQKMKKARDQWFEAISVMDAIIAEGPGAIPHPDGLLRIQQARRETRRAYMLYKEALVNYSGTLTRAQVPGANKAGTNHSARADDKPTRRETEVLQLICEGHSSKSIALLLGVSFKTITAHRESLFKKARVQNSIQLFRWAIQNGHVSLDPKPA